MSDFYDPYADPYFDPYADPYYFADPYAEEEEGFVDPFAMSGAMMQMLQPLPYEMGRNQREGAYDMPYDIGTYAAQGNAMQDDLDILGDPALALYGAALGMPTWDFMQTVPEEQPVPAPIVFTPTLDSLMNATSDNYRAVGEMVSMGASRPEINNAIRSKAAEGVISPEEADDLMKTAEVASSEMLQTQRQQLEFGQQQATMQPKPTEQQRALGKMGLPDPMLMYGDPEAPFPMELDYGDQEYLSRASAADRDAQRYERMLPSLEEQLKKETQQAFDELPEIGVPHPDGPGAQPRRSTQPRRPTGPGTVTAEHTFGDDGVLERFKEDFNPIEFFKEHATDGSFDNFGDNVSDLRRSRPTRGRYTKPQGPVAPRNRETSRKVVETRQKLSDAQRRSSGQRHLAELTRNGVNKVARQMLAEQGRTPFNDTMNARIAMMRMLRGG